MKWRKLGLIFCASGQNELMRAGGRAPVPLAIGRDEYRLYFGAYDALGRGRVFSLDMNISNPQEICNLITTPLLDIGESGFFDDNGIVPSDVLRVGSDIYLYTIGFSVKNRLLFDAAAGLAISTDNGASFSKFKGPIIDRGVDDPCFATSPTVMREGDEWRMWYVSCDRWVPQEDGFRHYYNIKHRRSQDGVYWDNRSTTCIDYANPHEYAIARPSVIREKDGRYRMWYSFRAQPSTATYRIGYAESLDGLRWTRMDEKAGIDVSDNGWDSEMICYPRVFYHGDQLYMLYNGNGYGKSGFGLAALEKDP
jgi:hypothetical protein